MHGNQVQLLHAAKSTWVRPMFMDIFIVASWSIWKEHNNKHFRGIVPTVGGWSQRFKLDFDMMRHRIKEALVPFVERLVASLEYSSLCCVMLLVFVFSSSFSVPLLYRPSLNLSVDVNFPM